MDSLVADKVGGANLQPTLPLNPEVRLMKGVPTSSRGHLAWYRLLGHIKLGAWGISMINDYCVSEGLNLLPNDFFVKDVHSIFDYIWELFGIPSTYQELKNIFDCTGAHTRTPSLYLSLSLSLCVCACVCVYVCVCLCQ